MSRKLILLLILFCFLNLIAIHESKYMSEKAKTEQVINSLSKAKNRKPKPNLSMKNFLSSRIGKRSINNIKEYWPIEKPS